MKVKKRTNGTTQCVLSKTELNQLQSSSAIIDQLGYHYRDTEFGDRCTESLSLIDSLFLDCELNPKTEKKEDDLQEKYQGNNSP